jgi:pimeloyl-ACP methyl ester carboxylesterase
VAPPGVAEPRSQALLAKTARFSEGREHLERRAAAQALMPDPARARETARLLTGHAIADAGPFLDAMPVARQVPVAALASCLGIPLDARDRVAALVGRLCDASAPSLLPRLPGDGLGDAADELAAVSAAACGSLAAGAVQATTRVRVGTGDPPVLAWVVRATGDATRAIAPTFGRGRRTLRAGRAEAISSRIGHTMDVPQFPGHDGVQLAYRETGSGRPLILLHGFMGTGSDWLDQGPGRTLAEAGFRLVLPDFRGHGQSPRPHDQPAYPPDVLADDALALISHLGLGAGQYDLGGYSLGGRIVVRMLARGAEPGRAVVAGQGLAKIAGPQGGGANRRAFTALADGTALPPGSTEAQIAHWAAKLGADPRALLCVLGSLVPTPEDDLRRITTPTLVVIGDRDERSDADELAALLPAGRFARVPGGHGGAFTAPELAAVIMAFLADPAD